MRLAQIQNGVVVNVIEVEAAAIPDWAQGWPEAGEAGPGWLMAEGVLAPPADPTPDMPALRAAARLQVVALIEAREAQLTGATPQNERASWSAKEAAARDWLADQDQPVPALIAAEAVVVGETALVVAQRIVDRADAWLPVTAAHTGRRRMAFAAIDVATTPEAITAALDALRVALG